MTWKVQACPKRMHSSGINGEGELRGQPANAGSPGKMAFKTECECVFIGIIMPALAYVMVLSDVCLSIA